MVHGIKAVLLCRLLVVGLQHVGAGCLLLATRTFPRVHALWI